MIPKHAKFNFVCVLPSRKNNRFRGFAYFEFGVQTNLILLHYVGDHQIALEYPHGNSQHSQPYYRTCPSALQTLKTSNNCRGNVYKKAVASNTCLPKYESILKPRNIKQIANLQWVERNKFRLSHDALYNLHELALDMNPFIISIKTFSDVLVVCGHRSLADELDGLLQAASNIPQLLSYDTTFQLGDFYLSAFLFRHTTFSTSPVIPCWFFTS